jgi:hypothetical protein
MTFHVFLILLVFFLLLALARLGRLSWLPLQPSHSPAGSRRTEEATVLVNAGATAIDLTRAQLDKADRPRWHGALFRRLPQGLQGLQGERLDHHRVLTHSCLYDSSPPGSSGVCAEGPYVFFDGSTN